MRKTKDDQKLIYELHTLMTDVSLIDVEKVFIALLTKVCLNYADGLPTNITFMGDLNINFVKDQYVDGRRVPILNITLDPSDLLKSVVGKIEDGDFNEIDEALIQDLVLLLRTKIDE